MMETQMAFYQSRQAVADPHRDMRLNIDEMSYEVDLLFTSAICSEHFGIFS
jgi:E3 ubiquitin-protein ligase RNF38/44